MKRLLTLMSMFILIFTSVAGISAQEREDRPNRDVEGNFWSAGEEQFEAWRVIDGVEEGAEIRFWPWALTPDFEDYLNKIIENFEATYPGVTVILEGQPAAGGRENIRNSFAAGIPADVINMSDGWIAEFAESGVLLDMDAALGEAYPEIRAQYVNGAWEKVAFNGTTNYIPWYLALSNTMAVNGLIMDELGLTEEDLPTTWQESFEFAQLVRDESGGAYYAYSLPWGELAGLGILNTFIGEGIDVLNEDGTQVVFNTPEAAAILDEYITLLENDYIPRESLRDDVREMIDRFSEGEIVLLQTGPQLLRLIEENNPEVFESLYLVNALVGEANIRSLGGVQTIAIPASTAYPNAALAFAVFMTNPEVQTAFSQEVPIYSSNLDSYNDPFFQSTGESLTDALRPLAQEYFTTAETISLPFPNLAEVEQVVLGEFQAALLRVKTSQQALDDMAARINEILAAASE